jgi:hypothetical protein
MPNWCGNTITLRAESDKAESAEERLKQILSEIKSEHSDFDFAKIVPPPIGDPEDARIYRGEPSQHSYVGCDCKSEYVGEAPNGVWLVNGKPPLKDNAKIDGSFASEIGSPVERCPDHLGIKVSEHPLFWWNWNIANWGTKWGVGGDDVSVSGYNPYDRAIYISFDTAWSPPMRILEQLSAKYPDLIVHIKYAEMGMGFIGENTFIAGECRGEGFWSIEDEGDTIEVDPFWEEDPKRVISKEYYDNGIRLWGDPEFMSIGG